MDRLKPQTLPNMSSKSIPNEASQIAILDSDASEHDKSVACHRLVYVAGPKSVAPLTALLTHEHLADYARSPLEAIEDPSASKALLDSLPNLKGTQLAGVVNSLGVRREAKAVPALQKLAADPASGVQAEAIASLGMIATPDAAGTLADIVTKGKEPLRTEAGHASIIAAEHLSSDGHGPAAKKLTDTVMTAFPAGPIHAAAEHISKG
jgi:hypothetical protein